MKSDYKILIGASIVVVLGYLVVRHGVTLPYRWQSFQSPDGAFSVTLPGTPKVVEKQLALADGSTLPLHTISTSPSFTIYYGCSYFDNPRFANRLPDEVLDSSRDGSLKKINATLTSETKIDVDGHPGRDIRAHMGADSVYDERVVEDGNRLYMLIVVYSHSSGRNEKDIQKFYDSFKTNDK